VFWFHPVKAVGCLFAWQVLWCLLTLISLTYKNVLMFRDTCQSSRSMCSHQDTRQTLFLWQTGTCIVAYKTRPTNISPIAKKFCNHRPSTVWDHLVKLIFNFF
jgi:hypothetical protein